MNNSLKAGFARADITPPNGISIDGYYNDRKAKGALDRLSASCIAVSDGLNTAAVISIDVMGIDQATGDIMRRVIAERTGLPYEAIFYACTHTHTGPTIFHNGIFGPDEAYNSIMFRLIADAVKDAVDDLGDAQVYINRGKVEDISFIRRYRMKDGSTRTNPGRGNPDIDSPIGSPDEQLQLVRIVREGKDDIVILNFQCHPDVIGGSYFSADWPGIVRSAFEGAVPGTKCIFLNGAQGDTNHLNMKRLQRGRYEHARHMGYCVAGEAMKLYTYAEKTDDDGRVGFVQYELNVPINRSPNDDVKESERLIALHEAEKYDEIPFDGMEYTTVIAEAYRIKKLENWTDTRDLHLCAVRFGDIAITGIPGEPFTAVGRAIKENSPFKMTIPCCLANGCEAYYPTEDAFAEGGYEARSSEFKSGVAEKIIDASADMLKKLY